MKKLTALLCALSLAFGLAMAFAANAFASVAMPSLYIYVQDAQEYNHNFYNGQTDWEDGGLGGYKYGIPNMTTDTFEGSNDKPDSGWYVEFDGTDTFTLTVLSFDDLTFDCIDFYDGNLIINLGCDVQFLGVSSINADPSILGGGNLSINGPATITFGTAAKPVSHALYINGKIVLNKLTANIFSRCDGIVAGVDEDCKDALEINECTVAIEDNGLLDSQKEDTELCCESNVVFNCGIHANGNVLIDSSAIDTSSVNQYGIYASGKLSLKNSKGGLAFVSRSTAKDALKVESFEIPEGFEVLAGDSAENASKTAASNAISGMKYVKVQEAAPDPTPKTADSAPVALFAGLMMLGAAAAFIARKRLA